MIFLLLLLACAGNLPDRGSESTLRTALEEARGFGTEDPRFAAAANGLAGMLVDQGKFIEAKRLLEAALPVLQTSAGTDYRDVVVCRARLAKCHLKLEQYQQAEALFLSVQPAAERSLGPAEPELAFLLMDLGNLYRVTGRFEESEKVLRRAVEILESTLGTKDVFTSRSYLEMGNTYYSMGRLPLAIRFLKRGLAVFENTPAQAESAQFWVKLGNAQFTAGQLKEAERAWERALLVLDCLPEMRLLKGMTLSNLGNLKLFQGRPAEAEPLILEAVALTEAQHGSIRELLPILGSLANLYSNRGEFELAEKTYNRALDLALSTVGPIHPDTAVLFQSLGRLRLLQKQPEKAAPFFERALESVEKSVGDWHPLYSTCLAEYAALMRKMNRKNEAKQAEARSRMIREQHRIQTLAVDTIVDARELQRR